MAAAATAAATAADSVRQTWKSFVLEEGRGGIELYGLPHGAEIHLRLGSFPGDSALSENLFCVICYLLHDARLQTATQALSTYAMARAVVRRAGLMLWSSFRSAKIATHRVFQCGSETLGGCAA